MTSEQRIAEWVDRLDTGLIDTDSLALVRAALPDLIASVRAEAAEEFCKLFDGYYYGPFEHPSSTIRRALVKERKG